MAKFLLGLLAGISIGMLIAPSRGSETVQRIADGYNDIKDTLNGDTGRTTARTEPERPSIAGTGTAWAQS
jgi:gas vesicle protein